MRINKIKKKIMNLLSYVLYDEYSVNNIILLIWCQSCLCVRSVRGTHMT